VAVAADDDGYARPETPARDQPRPVAQWLLRVRRIHLGDALVAGVFLLGGLFVTSKLWVHLDRMVFTSSDEMLIEWAFARAARAVTQLENPLFDSQLNVPDGVNLIANTSVLGLGIPLTPITLLFGAHIAYLVAVLISLAGTATSWYFVLLRTAVRSRAAAFIGAAFCGFAPSMASQATGHVHLIAQFLVPPIVWAVCRLGRSPRVVRHGVVLGLLVTYQVFLSEELLLFTVLGLGVFTVTYALVDWSAARQQLRRFCTGLGVAALTASVLLAYPLWFQFFGPQHYRGLPFSPTSYFMDLAAYTTYNRQSLTGFDQVPGLISPNPTEENAFFGLALLGLCAVIVVWLWRSATVKALAVTAVVFFALSLGPTVQLNGVLTGVPGPARLVAKLPIIELAVPARYPLIIAGLIGVLLALSTDRAWTARQSTDAPLRLVWVGAILAVLLPLAPIPLRSYPAPPMPQFISSGRWRQFVTPGHTVVPVPPLNGSGSLVGIFWSARAGADFAVPGGYFNGPTSSTNVQARNGPFARPTGDLLAKVADTGKVPVITDRDREQARADLRYWRGAVVVLAPGGYTKALHRTLDALLGPGQLIEGAWVWDVRPLVA
jgi:hypothetical protein